MTKRRAAEFMVGGFFLLLATAVGTRSSYGGENIAPLPSDVSKGQAAVDRYLELHKAALADPRSMTSQSIAARAGLDEVCGQKDCYASRFFWHRDLNSAVQEAERVNRPILALHLLGNLTDEMSCANSRLFRSVLYSDPSISKYLRENYVVYWKSVRSVPQLTVDFGQGQKLKQTITGNSIHYLLNKQGKPIDALPGLYEPRVFLSALKNFRDSAPWSETSIQPAALKEYFDAQSKKQNSYQTAEFRRIAEQVSNAIKMDREMFREASAASAGRLAISKVAFEGSALRSFPSPEDLKMKKAKEEALLQLTALLPERLNLREMLHYSSILFIEAKSPGLRPEAFERLAKTLRTDTLLNDGVFRPEIQKWLASAETPIKLSNLNTQVYREIFETPLNDPWMGLDPTRVYGGLPNGGVEGGPFFMLQDGARLVNAILPGGV